MGILRESVIKVRLNSSRSIIRTSLINKQLISIIINRFPFNNRAGIKTSQGVFIHFNSVHIL